MNIALINPPVEEWSVIAKNKYKKAMLNIVAPLGIAYIASVLEKNNYQVKIFDFSIGAFKFKMMDYLKNNSLNIIGITATSLSIGNAKKIAMNIRKVLPKSIIVIGGPHITALPLETMDFEYFDIGVIGEGETTFLELIKRIEKSGLEYLEDIDGIVYKKNGNIVLNRRRDFIKNPDEIPFPARHLLPPLSEYSPTPASYKHLPVAVIITSRGCPMECIFCDKAVFGSIYRARSCDNVLDEIEVVMNRFGAKEITFYDDTFTLDKNRVFELCDKMKRRNIKVSWSCLTSVNCVSKELLRKMKEAGCWQVWFGLESGDERVLNYLRKGVTVSQNKRAVKWAKEAGLNVRATFVIGSPCDTKESLERTLDFAKKLNIDYAHFNKCTPFPGSQLYNMLIQKGYHFDFTQNFDMLSHDNIMYVPESLKREEFVDFLKRARKEFYCRPSYILRRLFFVRSWGELKNYILGFLAIKNS